MNSPRNQFLCLAVELLRPPLCELHGVGAVEGDHLHVECHTRDPSPATMQSPQGDEERAGHDQI